MNLDNSILLQILLGVIILYLLRFLLKKIIKPGYYRYAGLTIIAVTLAVTALIPNSTIMNVLFIAVCVTGASLLFEKLNRY